MESRNHTQPRLRYLQACTPALLPDRMRRQWVGALTVLLTGTALCLVATAGIASGTIYKTTQPDGTVVFTDQPMPDAKVVTPSPLNIADAPEPAPADVDSSGGNPTTESSTEPANEASVDGDGREYGDTNAAVGSNAITPEIGGVASVIEPSGDTLEAEAGPNEPATAAATPVSNEPIGPDLVSGDSEATGLDEPETGKIGADGNIETVTIISPIPDETMTDPVDPVWVEFSTDPGSLKASGLSAEIRLDDELVASGSGQRLPIKVPDRGTHTLQVRLVDHSGDVIHASEPQAVHVRKRVVNNTN